MSSDGFCDYTHIHPPVTLKEPNTKRADRAYCHPERVAELIASNLPGSHLMKYAEMDSAERQKMWEPMFNNVYDVLALSFKLGSATSSTW